MSIDILDPSFPYRTVNAIVLLTFVCPIFYILFLFFASEIDPLREKIHSGMKVVETVIYV